MSHLSDYLKKLRSSVKVTYSCNISGNTLSETKKLSMREVGRIIGMSDAFLCQLESGKRNMRTTTLIKIADFYGISPMLLIDEIRKDIKEKA